LARAGCAIGGLKAGLADALEEGMAGFAMWLEGPTVTLGWASWPLVLPVQPVRATAVVSVTAPAPAAMTRAGITG